MSYCDPHFIDQTFNDSNFADLDLPSSVCGLGEELAPYLGDTSPYNSMGNYGQPSQGGIWNIPTHSTTLAPSDLLHPAVFEPYNVVDHNLMDQSLFSDPSTAAKQDLKNSCINNGQPTPPFEPFEPSLPFSEGTTEIPPYQLDASQPGTLPLGPNSQSVPLANIQSAPLGIEPNPVSSAPTKMGRRRQSKKTVEARNKPRPNSSSSGSDTPPKKDPKREQYLARNRLAASKCRNRKKERDDELWVVFKREEKRKEFLLAEASKFREQLLWLKNELLRHADCGNPAIDRHLAKMVQKIYVNDQNSDGFSVNTTHTISPDVSPAQSSPRVKVDLGSCASFDQDIPSFSEGFGFEN